MGIKVHLYSGLPSYTGDRDVVEASGHTVGECISNLVVQFPELKSILLDEKGELLDYIFISINLESASPEELTTPVKEKDELHIGMIIAGG